MGSRSAWRYACSRVTTTPSRARAIASSNSVGHGARPNSRCALSRPATTPGTAADAAPIPNDCVVEPKSTSIQSMSPAGPAIPAPGTVTKKSSNLDRPSLARCTSRKPPPPGPVSVLSATQDTNAAARQASTAFPPSASTRAPASAVSGWPAAIAPFTAPRLALQERRRLERLRAFVAGPGSGPGAAPLADAGHDHRHPNLAFEPLVDRRAEDDVRIVD